MWWSLQTRLRGKEMLERTLNDPILKFGFNAEFAEAFSSADVLQEPVNVTAALYNANEGLKIEVTTPHRGHSSNRRKGLAKEANA